MKSEHIRQLIMWGMVAIVLIGVSFHSCEYFYEKYDIKPDNIIEEAVEDVIDEKTGIRLDLSPESPE